MSKIITPIVTLSLLISSVCYSQDRNDSQITIHPNDTAKVGTSVPASEIGEPVGSVKLYCPRWVGANESTPAYMVMEGYIMPVDPEGWPINFRILLPEKWTLRSMQQGGGGMNGTITVRHLPKRLLLMKRVT
jgi:hypothetical protein